MATPIPLNRARFSLKEILAATGGRLRGPLEDAGNTVEGIATDSRTIQPGNAFVALAGERFDGHDHLASVAERGASLAIVERDVRVAGLTTLQVASTLEALGRIAALHLARWRSGGPRHVIALTGSAGKTTTKRAIAALLEARFPGRIHATIGNLNNLVGVPMTMLALTEGSDVTVLEMGTNSPGEIGRLARMARPDVGLVTLIASAHSRGLGGLEGIAREKTAMFREVALGGSVIGNADDARVAAGLEASAVARRISYGTDVSATYRIVGRHAVGLDRAMLEVRRADGSTLSFATPLLGEAGALASVAAIAVVEQVAPDAPLGSSEIEAALAPLASLDEGPGRMQARTLPSGVVVLDDSYNANPASCRASIAAARELAASQKRALVLVLGDMLELGADGDSAHDELGEWAAASGARLLIAIGAHAGRTAESARRCGLEVVHAATAQDAGAIAPTRIDARDLVLVKGSRGIRTELVIDALAGIQGGGATPHSGVHA